MTIAITGATGQLGRLIIERLRTTMPAESIIALARSPEKAADLGVIVRQADYDRPVTLGPALVGVDTLLLISASEIGKRVAQHHAVIDAATQSSVQWIVYTSLLHADRSSIGLAQEHLATEREIEASGIPFTILRNGWYTENYTSSIPGALAGGAFLGAAGEGKIASASRTDFADAAVAVLASGRQKNAGKIYELAGDTAWTLSDLAAEIARQTGKTIPYRNLSEADYAAALEGFGLPEPLAQAIAGWDTSAAQGALFDDSRELSRLIGHPTRPLSTTVADALGSVP